MKWLGIARLLLCIALVIVLGGIVAVVLLIRSGKLPGEDFVPSIFLAIMFLALINFANSRIEDRELEEEWQRKEEQRKLKEEQEFLEFKKKLEAIE